MSAPTPLPSRLRAVLVAPDFRRVVTVGEILAFGLALVAAVVGLVSLATAHLGIFTLTSVVVSATVLLAGVAVLVRWSGPRPAVVWDPIGLLVLAGAAAVAAWFFLPGFHYGSGDRDPGGYIMHAITIAREHSYAFTDPVLAQGLPVQVASPGARFAGVWIDDPATGRIVPQFYHLWPALLATSWNLHGWEGIALTTPLLGIVAVLLAVVLARRVAAGTGVTGGAMSLVAASATGLLLGTNMLQVWQAKYPTSEILAQLLFTAALLGIAVAIQTRWRWPAGVAGALVAVGYLNRADGVLIVLGVIAFGALLVGIRRFDARCWWFAAGLGVLLPYGAWQAYGPAHTYTTLNLPLTLPLFLAALVAAAVGALALRAVWARVGDGIEARLANPVLQRRATAAFIVVLLGLFLLGLARPLVFGADYAANNGGELERTYDEITLYRLAWFFTWPGWLLMLGGASWAALRRRAAGWVVLTPLVVLLPLYAWHAHNSPYFMWWGRRFIPTVIVGVIVMAALALGWLASRWLLPRGERVVASASARQDTILRWGCLALAACLALPMLYTGVQQSRPLQSHDEFAGVRPLGRELAALAGDATPVWLWDQGADCCNQAYLRLAPTMWLTWDQLSVLLPSRPEMVPGYVKTYVDHFTDQPVFLVYEDDQTPPDFPGVRLTEVQSFSGQLQRWDESSIKRPAGPIWVVYDIRVYRATAA